MIVHVWDKWWLLFGQGFIWVKQFQTYRHQLKMFDFDEKRNFFQRFIKHKSLIFEE